MTTEILEKTKRGRPPVMDAAEYHYYKNLWSDRIETRRGLLNKHYAIKGFGTIKKMQDEGSLDLNIFLIRLGKKVSTESCKN